MEEIILKCTVEKTGKATHLNEEFSYTIEYDELGLGFWGKSQRRAHWIKHKEVFQPMETGPYPTLDKAEIAIKDMIRLVADDYDH